MLQVTIVAYLELPPTRVQHSAVTLPSCPPRSLIIVGPSASKYTRARNRGFILLESPYTPISHLSWPRASRMFLNHLPRLFIHVHRKAIPLARSVISAPLHMPADIRHLLVARLQLRLSACQRHGPHGDGYHSLVGNGPGNVSLLMQIMVHLNTFRSSRRLHYCVAALGQVSVVRRQPKANSVLLLYTAVILLLETHESLNSLLPPTGTVFPSSWPGAPAIIVECAWQHLRGINKLIMHPVCNTSSCLPARPHFVAYRRPHDGRATRALTLACQAPEGPSFAEANAKTTKPRNFFPSPLLFKWVTFASLHASYLYMNTRDVTVMCLQ